MDTVFNHPSRVLHKIFIRTISKVPEELIVDEIEGEALFDIAADKPAGNAVFKQLERAAPGLRGKLVPFPKERGREEFAVRLFAAGKGGVNALDEARPSGTSPHIAEMRTFTPFPLDGSTTLMSPSV